MKGNGIYKGKVQFSVPGHYWLTIAADNASHFCVCIPQIETVFFSGRKEIMFLWLGWRASQDP